MQLNPPRLEPVERNKITRNKKPITGVTPSCSFYLKDFARQLVHMIPHTILHISGQFLLIDPFRRWTVCYFLLLLEK